MPYTTPFNLKDITLNSGTIRCKCTKQLSLVKNIPTVVCPYCHRQYSISPKPTSPQRYSLDGFKCPRCALISPTLFKLVSHPQYYICSKCMHSTLNALIQTRDMCDAMIKELTGVNFITQL